MWKREGGEVEFKGHKNLIIWQKSMDLVEDVYLIVRKFSREEMYGITSQIKRASISIPSNIAEGAARNSKKEFIQFLYYSLDSLSEIETQILIAKRLKYINECDTILKKIWNLKKIINNFIKTLK